MAGDRFADNTPTWIRGAPFWLYPEEVAKVSEMFVEQLWQVPARLLIAHGVKENQAIELGEALVRTGLVTEATARAYVAQHPEHAPSV